MRLLSLFPCQLLIGNREEISAANIAAFLAPSIAMDAKTSSVASEQWMKCVHSIKCRRLSGIPTTGRTVFAARTPTKVSCLTCCKYLATSLRQSLQINRFILAFYYCQVHVNTLSLFHISLARYISQLLVRSFSCPPIVCYFRQFSPPSLIINTRVFYSPLINMFLTL